jgi:hypothetical protein
LARCSRIWQTIDPLNPKTITIWLFSLILIKNLTNYHKTKALNICLKCRSSSHQIVWYIWLQINQYIYTNFKKQIQEHKKCKDKRSIKELTTSFNLARAQQRKSICQNWVEVNVVHSYGIKRKSIFHMSKRI